MATEGKIEPKARPGTIDQAIANGRSLLDSHPEVALRQAEVLLRGGDDPRAHRLSAAALRKLGQPAEAEAAELAAIKASFKDPELEKAAVAQAEGRGSESRTIAEAAVSRDPDDLLALTLAAEAAIGLRDYKSADRYLARVLDRAPSFLRAAMLRGKSLLGQSRLSEALEVTREVLARKPTNVPALRMLASATTETGDHEGALAAYEKLIETGGAEPENWIMYAQTLRILGRKDESKAAFRRALELDPGHGAAWWGLTHFFPSEIGEKDEEAMRSILSDRAGTSSHAAPAHIALSIVAERRGEREQAFHHVSEGKRLRNEAQPYSPDFVSVDVDQALKDFSADFYAKRSRCGSKDSAPIFVVGMPRSGSTLVERILGRHSKVEATGELQILPRIVEELRYRTGRPVGYSALTASLPCDELTRLGDYYAARSQDYRHAGKPHFTDKLNLNWLHSGLIRAILPEARIIDVRRDALDCCWSNFKMLFAAGHANDQRGMARFYRDYVRFMDGIDSAAPGGILQVRYEQVVDDLEGQTRRMLDFLGLDWEPGCIDFHLSDSPVATPSSEQVRRPINRDSIGSSEPYRAWLGPMIEELGELDFPSSPPA